MAETEARNSGKGDNQRRQSRLQRRAPASIQVNPASSFAAGWKVAIPLLSPLAMSPTSPPKFGDRTAEISSSSNREESRQISTSSSQTTTTEKPSLKTWQHPAGPFYYEPAKPAKFVPSFVPRCR
ncbi:hypothetical protein BVC80_9099g264 [Macleaya cordata]|uniref:Uncharacterized protein n=1 Tax=Macleaya cordata TaxID=56857 RepID=A0A200PW62_MACCD|nr:hypothetical protein BVC80_9099g264 [Macleaya cordata]